MVVVVLDEMDNLVTKDQEVLYNLFQLAAYQHSTVLMIGVANSIDLVHRLLPRLHAMDCQPGTLHFKAYDHTSLKEPHRLGPVLIVVGDLKVAKDEVARPCVCAEDVAVAHGLVPAARRPHRLGESRAGERGRRRARRLHRHLWAASAAVW